MALTSVVIEDPLCVILTSDVGGLEALFNFNVVTGVVTSPVLPARMCSQLTEWLQKMIVADPTLATDVFIPKLIWSMFYMDRCNFGGGLITTTEQDAGDDWVLYVTLAAGNKIFVAIPHSINQPFAVRDFAED